MSKEEKIGGHYYKAGKLSAWNQMRVASGLAPFLGTGAAEAMPIVGSLIGSGKIKTFADLFNLPIAELVFLLQPLGVALGSWDDEKREQVMSILLSCVERRSDGGPWTPVWNKEAGRAMFDDINYDFMVMIQICILSFRENLANFFLERLSNSEAE